MLVASSAGAQAPPVNGFPNWEERVLHEWINRARVDPATDLLGCGTNCSAAELLPTCYAPTAPLMWEYNLSVAARFHDDSMARQSFFAHDTPCVLRSDLKNVYPSSCDGSAACACSGTGSTSPGSRAALFGASWSGEIIAAGYPDPDSAFYGWLNEPAPPTQGCGFSTANGHRWLILKGSNSIGAGYSAGGPYGAYYSADFGGGGAVSQIPSGVHFPRQASTIDFWANWYASAAPRSGSVVIGTVSYPLTLARGTSTNGAWKTTVNGLGTGCYRYYFEFLDSTGKPVRHPSTGTFGIGPAATCADWAGTDLPAPALTATAMTTTSVQVSWTSSPGATQYALERSVDNVPFAPLMTVSSTGYVDNAVTQSKTYLYRVRPVGGSTWSNIDHATTMMFTDDPIIANTTLIRAVHIAEIRTAVNAARASAGLMSVAWTDAAVTGVAVKAAHILELRSALSAALTALGKSVGFTNTVSAGMPPRAVDFQELRNALK